MVILVVDFAASSGGALSILKEYYEKALKDKSNQYYFIISNDYIEEKNNVKTIILKERKGWLKRLLFDYYNGKKIVKHIISTLMPNIRCMLKAKTLKIRI